MHVLARMVDKACSSTLLRGFVIGKDKIEVSHLQFADDTIFFVKDNSSLQIMRDVLKIFCCISGMKINPLKSQLLGINFNENLVEQFAGQIGCEVGTWPMKYLGLPLGGNPRKISFWEPVIAKCAKRLDNWKSAFLSRGGRFTLIQSVLSALPTYYLSIFKAPKSVTNMLEKIMRDFLWEGGDLASKSHLVSWDVVCKPRSQGGLGIGKIDARNKAFLMKWLWRFPLESGSLWHKVIRSRFGNAENFWDTKKGERKTFRSPWKGIAELYDEFLNFIEYKIGKGDKIRFWEDIWIENNALKDRFSDLAAISLAKNRSIRDMMVENEAGTNTGQGWNFFFRRNLHDNEVASWVNLMSMIENFSACELLEDSRIWKPNKSGDFSCKSAYDALRSDNLIPEEKWTKFLWRSLVPSRIKVFGWLLLVERLNVQENLQKRHSYIAISPGWCVCCRNNAETASHLFLECSMVQNLWSKMLCEFGIHWCMPQNCKQLLVCKIIGDKRKYKIWTATVLAVFWAVWLERNRRIFEEREETTDKIWEKIKFWVATWIYKTKGFEGLSFLELSREWTSFL